MGAALSAEAIAARYLASSSSSTASASASSSASSAAAAHRRVAIVTGANTGIGKQTALALGANK
jgi:hypothetical protein